MLEETSMCPTAIKLAAYRQKSLDRVRSITGIKHPTHFTDYPPDSTLRREEPSVGQLGGG
jgi:hypothetical protein